MGTRRPGTSRAVQAAVQKIFADTLGDLSQGMAFGVNVMLRLAEVRSRTARLPGPYEIKALDDAALAELIRRNPAAVAAMSDYGEPEPWHRRELMGTS